MTITEKMILSGILLILTMYGLAKLLAHNRIGRSVFIDYLALLGSIDVIAFSAFWIWSQ